MGWSGVHKPKNITTVEFLKKEWDGNEKYEIVDSAMCAYSRVVFAVRQKELNFVFAVVYLTQFGKDYYNFHYKSMDEFCGPNYDCPKKILKLLTPIEEIARLENETIEYPKEGEKYGGNGYYYALEWRKRSQEKIDSIVPIKDGDIIEMEKAVDFTSGDSYSCFKKVGKSLFAVDPRNPSHLFGRVRFNPRKSKYRVLTAQEIGQRISVPS